MDGVRSGAFRDFQKRRGRHWFWGNKSLNGVQGQIPNSVSRGGGKVLQKIKHNVKLVSYS